MKNVKDLTSEDSRGSIFDEDTLLGSLDTVSEDDPENAESNEAEGVEPPKVETLTEAALDELEAEPCADQKKMISAIPNTTENRKPFDKRSSSWGGEGIRALPIDGRSTSILAYPPEIKKSWTCDN